MNTDKGNSTDVRSPHGTGGADVQELLSDPHVRHLLDFLRDEEGPVDLSTAAVHVTAGITGKPPEEVPDDVQDRIQTFLHHGHIPELATHGFLEYDSESNTLVLTR